jgi:hypothetical protein
MRAMRRVVLSTFAIAAFALFASASVGTEA